MSGRAERPIARPAAAQVPADSLLSHVGWQVLATAAARGAVVVSLILLARRLALEPYGAVATVRSTIAFLVPFALAGLSFVAAKSLSRHIADDRTAAGRILVMVTCASLVLASLVSVFLVSNADFIATRVLADAGLSPTLQLAAGILALECLGTVLSGIMVGLREFRRLAVSNCLGALFYLPIIFVVSEPGSIRSAVLAILYAEAIMFSFRLAATLRALSANSIRPVWQIGLPEFRLLRDTALPATLNGLSAVPFMWLGVALLVNADDGYQQMAFYGAAFPWFSSLLFLPNQIATTLLPRLSTSNANGAKDQFDQTLRRGLKYIALAVSPALLIAVFSPFVMGLYGVQYREGWPVLCILAVAAAATSFQNLLTNAMAADDRLWTAAGFSVVWCLTFSIAVTTFVSQGWGAAGLAGAILLAYLAKLLMFLRAYPATLSSRPTEVRA